MKTTDFQYTFESVVSFDDGETVETVTVAYDYLPEELNYSEAPDYAEHYDVFVFDATGKDITYDIPQDETERLLEEAKEDYKQVVADANEI
jgi:uncharacterized membrane protein